MMEIRETAVFSAWLERLRDPMAKARIGARLRRLAFSNPGDVRPIGGGLSELRIHYGPGYRVYFTQRSEALIILLCGGDKGTQRRDIATARILARKLEA
jgi:putative addiction module killer protein